MPTKNSKRKPKASHAHDNAAHAAPVEEPATQNEPKGFEEAAASEEIHAQHEQTTDEVKLDFPYSELVRAYVPKAMDVADKVATDWKKDGSFMNLGIDNPYANMAVSLGLQKAKEIEKKLDEKGVLSMVRMGVEVLKQQVNKKK